MELEIWQEPTLHAPTAPDRALPWQAMLDAVVAAEAVDTTTRVAFFVSEASSGVGVHLNARGLPERALVGGARGVEGARTPGGGYGRGRELA